MIRVFPDASTTSVSVMPRNWVKTNRFCWGAGRAPGGPSPQSVVKGENLLLWEFKVTLLESKLTKAGIPDPDQCAVSCELALGTTHSRFDMT